MATPAPPLGQTPERQINGATNETNVQQDRFTPQKCAYDKNNSKFFQQPSIPPTHPQTQSQTPNGFPPNPNMPPQAFAPNERMLNSQFSPRMKRGASVDNMVPRMIHPGMIQNGYYPASQQQLMAAMYQQQSQQNLRLPQNQAFAPPMYSQGSAHPGFFQHHNMMMQQHPGAMQSPPPQRSFPGSTVINLPPGQTMQSRQMLISPQPGVSTQPSAASTTNTKSKTPTKAAKAKEQAAASKAESATSTSQSTGNLNNSSSSILSKVDANLPILPVKDLLQTASSLISAHSSPSISLLSEISTQQFPLPSPKKPCGLVGKLPVAKQMPKRPAVMLEGEARNVFGEAGFTAYYYMAFKRVSSSDLLGSQFDQLIPHDLASRLLAVRNEPVSQESFSASALETKPANRTESGMSDIPDPIGDDDHLPSRVSPLLSVDISHSSRPPVTNLSSPQSSLIDSSQPLSRGQRLANLRAELEQRVAVNRSSRIANTWSKNIADRSASALITVTANEPETATRLLRYVCAPTSYGSTTSSLTPARRYRLKRLKHLLKLKTTSSRQRCASHNNDLTPCTRIALPRTNHCILHVSCSLSQKLFPGFCSARIGDTQESCGAAATNLKPHSSVEPRCHLHLECSQPESMGGSALGSGDHTSGIGSSQMSTKPSNSKPGAKRRASRRKKGNPPPASAHTYPTAAPVFNFAGMDAASGKPPAAGASTNGPFNRAQSLSFAPGSRSPELPDLSNDDPISGLLADENLCLYDNIELSPAAMEIFGCPPPPTSTGAAAQPHSTNVNVPGTTQTTSTRPRPVDLTTAAATPSSSGSGSHDDVVGGHGNTGKPHQHLQHTPTTQHPHMFQPNGGTVVVSQNSSLMSPQASPFHTTGPPPTGIHPVPSPGRPPSQGMTPQQAYMFQQQQMMHAGGGGPTPGVPQCGVANQSHQWQQMQAQQQQYYNMMHHPQARQHIAQHPSAAGPYPSSGQPPQGRMAPYPQVPYQNGPPPGSFMAQGANGGVYPNGQPGAGYYQNGGWQPTPQHQQSAPSSGH